MVPVLLLALGLSQTACRNLRKAEAARPADETGTADQPGLLTVSQDQLSHLQVAPVRKASWPTTVRTTGTVDWDADHTTQAITQVNGPISRILVDTGAKVNAGRSPALRLQPGRRQRHLGLSQSAQPGAV